MKPVRCAGQSSVEYAVVCALAVIVLILSDNNIAAQLVQAMQLRFEQFALMMAAP